MESLKKYQPIQEGMLDQGQYFQTLFMQACKNQLLSETEIERIQLELIDLLGKEVERYNNGESSSIRVEKAQNILQSLTFNIGIYLKSFPDIQQKIDTLRQERIIVLFHKGMDLAAEVKNKAWLLLETLKKNFKEINNIAYHDTIINGIDDFFHDYDIEFGAHEIPVNIDYPLLNTNTCLLGVEFIYEYLRELTIEQNFLNHFTAQKMNQLLYGFHKESEHMLINLFELVLTNALGCALLEQNVLELHISSKNCSWLQRKLEKLTKEEITDKLDSALEQIATELSLEEEIRLYAQTAIPPLSVRIGQNLKTGTLQEIFISFAEETLAEEVFEDGEEMENEKLRELIEKLKYIDPISGKLDEIRKSVHSLSDFIELLEEAFYYDELNEVLSLLNDTEITLLRNRIKEEAGPEFMEGFIPDKEWQRLLLKYNRKH